MPFTKCITKIDRPTIDHAEDLDLVIPKYNLTEQSSNYSETTRGLWLYSNDGATTFIADIAKDNNFNSFKYRAKLLRNIGANTVSCKSALSCGFGHIYWRNP